MKDRVVSQPELHPMKILKVLLVDDEDPSRARMRRMLEKYPEWVEVVGEANDGKSALSQFRQLQPDVVFLDVQMPPPNGLEVAAELADEEAPPWVVFLTAFAEHAVKAFELKALDYLVKPVSGERLQATLQRLREQNQDGEDWREAVSENLQKALPEAQFGARRPARCRDGKSPGCAHRQDRPVFESRGALLCAHGGSRVFVAIHSNPSGKLSGPKSLLSRPSLLYRQCHSYSSGHPVV